MSHADSAWTHLSEGKHRHAWTGGRQAFVKIRRGMPPGFFIAEANGLATLAATASLRVPAVWAVETHGIALEDLGHGRAQSADWEVAGRRLAALHGAKVAKFGFDMDGWCGDSPQDNRRDDDGYRFFAERRLLPQARRAFDAGRLQDDDMRRVETLSASLSQRLPARAPSLVHGDLWLGNLHACADGELALVDGAAVHHGWPETDLAMLTLFGEPPEVFFRAYESAAGIDRTWRRRAPVFNLYHLLNHLNLFGKSYLAAVREVLDAHA